YHLAPDNDRLVWDRLPMTIVFMALVAAMIIERISVPIGLALLPLLSFIGIASVVEWHLSEINGASDLRFYAALQGYAVLLLLAILLLPPRYTRSSDLAAVVGFYVLAKITEAADRPIFAFGHVASGHTIKHLAAAAAGLWIMRMLQKATACATPGKRLNRLRKNSHFVIPNGVSGVRNLLSPWHFAKNRSLASFGQGCQRARRFPQAVKAGAALGPMSDLAAHDRCYRPPFEGAAVKRGIARFARGFLHAVGPRTIQRKNRYIRLLAGRQFAFFTQDARGAAGEQFHHAH